VRELERFISFTVPKNAASLRAMEKCGLVQQGERDGVAWIEFGTLSTAGIVGRRELTAEG
jgi:RimJ/RimL family protein N-acetyltransferase